jgi:hypothetical protein
VASVGTRASAGRVWARVAGHRCACRRLALAWARAPLPSRAQGRRAPVSGWLIPPPSRPVKSEAELRREREAKIAEFGRRGLLRSERLRRAMLTVRRENFIPPRYRDHA